MSLHRIFVYGTLKQGFCNHHVNVGRRVGTAHATAVAYPLLVIGERCLPWLLNRPGQGVPVVGELYEVDDHGLALMDELEQIDEAGWYERVRITVRPCDAQGRPEPGGEGGADVETWVYFGSEAGAAGQVVHAGPLAAYTRELEARYRPRAD